MNKIVIECCNTRLPRIKSVYYFYSMKLCSIQPLYCKEAMYRARTIIVQKKKKKNSKLSFKEPKKSQNKLHKLILNFADYNI